MEVFQAIKNRRSVRNFLEKEISEEKEEKLIDALLWAPSAGNLQSRKFYFIKNNETKEKLAKAAFSQNFISLAPLVVVGCADLRVERQYGKRGKEIYSICDVAVAIENMMIEAVELGLGSCWVGAFDDKEVKRILNLPDFLLPIAIVPIGYTDDLLTPPQRKSKEEIIEKIQ